MSASERHYILLKTFDISTLRCDGWFTLNKQDQRKQVFLQLQCQRMPDITMFDFNSVKVVSVKKQRRKSLENPHIPIPWLLLKFNGQNHVSLTATSNG